MLINSVLGPVETKELGTTLMHEHIACYSSFMHKAFGDKWFERDKLIEMASNDLRKAKEQYNIRTVVDGTPLNLGRDIRMLQEVSRKSGVNIIASSGLYYTEEPFLLNKPAEQLAELFIDECKNGMEGTTALPGMLKCATDAQGFTSTNKMLLKMISLVHKATGLPIFAHSNAHIQTGTGQLDLLIENGVDPGRVIIGHCADTTDLEYMESLLNRGCYIGLDRYRYLEQRVDMIVELIKRGWIGRFILSHDSYTFIDFNTSSWEKRKEAYAMNDENGYTFIHRKIVPLLLQKGITELQILQIFIDTPKNFLESGTILC